MRRGYALLLIVFLAVFGACGDDPDAPVNKVDADGLPTETKLKELDGIPSPFSMDRLLFYVNSHEDNPGLFAYNPTTKETIYVDPKLNLSHHPFVQVLPLGTIQSDDKIVDYRAGGVLYDTLVFEEIIEGTKMMMSQYTYVSSDPSQGATPTPVSATTVIPGSGMSGILSYDLTDLHGSSFLQFLGDNTRFDVGMDQTTPAIVAPSGNALISALGEDKHTHEHWLWITDAQELVFYDRDYTHAIPVIDHETHLPITNVTPYTTFITGLTHDQFLIAIRFADTEASDPDALPTGIAYVVTVPDDTNTATARRILNDQGEPYEFPFDLLGGTMQRPDPNASFVRDGTLIFAKGDSLFDSILGAQGTPGINLIKMDGETWRQLNIQRDAEDDEELIGMNLPMVLPNVIIPVPGHGIFWAPDNKPEIIDVTSDDPSQWTRTALDASLPAPEDTPSAESANGWIYYNHDERTGGAIAYHVPTKKVVHLRDAEWVGVSSNGQAETTAGSIARLSISEVFVRTADNKLGAVAAEAPNEGIVILGQLPETTEHLVIQGPGTGPHRLIGIEHNDDSCEVVAVDTTQKESLTFLMESPATEWKTKLEEDDSPLSFDYTISPQRTRPVSLY